MVRQERDPDLLNRLSNDPEVIKTLPNLGGVVDFSPLFAYSPNGCIALSNGEDAAQVFEMTDARDWKVVTIFGPTCRGARALEMARAFKAWMMPFADFVWGPVPNTLRGAKWFYRQLGGYPVDEVTTGGETYVANPGDTLFAYRVAR